MNFLSKITVHPTAGPRELFSIARVDAYGIHELVWDLFADHADRRRDFLFRLERDQGRPLLYVLSERRPEANGSALQVECREWTPKLIEGDTLRFRLRVNPVRSSRDDNDRQHRYDVVMHRRFHEKKGGKGITPLHCIVQEEGEKWFRERGVRSGFEVLAVIADGYTQHRFAKRKGGPAVTIGTVELEGVLRVLDVQTFLRMVHSGFGPAKGFGCGLMLLRRA
ncbi:MAG: type I-E CRISPR-associated protein Cas6/Cse3/CasE [Ignavibacteriae bacterium]|nr:type I-E CRISPR-associated protein Cas6/Cse3/CasE [Ignavibacteriota bacterium]